MLRTPVCDLLGIEVPIVQAGMSRFTSADLTAAASNAGALGSLGAGLRPADEHKAELARLKQLTDRPFAVNHTLYGEPDEEALAASIAARPAVMTFSLGDPVDFVDMVHDAGILVMQQVTTVDQASQAISRGVDVLIAQGAEAGGFSGTTSTLPLVPEIVDIAGSIPVLAAGGIADGRGLAAVLELGAQGANVGTRFLASTESSASSLWKQRIVESTSEQTVKFDVWSAIFPTPPGAYEISPRALRTPYIEEWNHRPEEARAHADELAAEFASAVDQGRIDELMPWAGETVGLITQVQPVAEIVRDMIETAEARLAC